MITTHVLDTARGTPANGVTVVLARADGTEIGRGVTDSDGRLACGEVGVAGTYRLTFDTAAHSAFYPEVNVVFRVEAPAEDYHVPLLLAPFGYTTYRGS